MNRPINTKELKELVLDVICPSGIWQLSQDIELLLNRHLKKLPSGDVTDQEARFPTTKQGIHVYLDKFFTRHYFQLQNSLIDYFVSDDFLEKVLNGRLTILDIGCGPAVFSIAATEMLNSLISIMTETGLLSHRKKVELTYVLNDISPICLGTAKQMLNDYFEIGRNMHSIIPKVILGIDRGFPLNLKQLGRIAQNYGSFDIISLAYVIIPLVEQSNISGVADNIFLLENLCSESGRVTILVCKFIENIIRRLGRIVKVPVRQMEYTQRVYSSENTNETFTYLYYESVYKPRVKFYAKRLYDSLPNQAVAFAEITSAA
ncbi:MAG: hypothetical protein WC374_02465 [Phycisphaerae bacterium]|jgi:ribosomal protein RSM22 (predicted rRNA methylase)